MKEEQEAETLDGLSIEVRPLTEEEYNRKITLERFQNYHHEIGEDFCDDYGGGRVVANARYLFLGYLMGKYPNMIESFENLLKNLRYNLTLQDIQGVWSEFEDDDNRFYEELAYILNFTRDSKRRVNEQLIIATEYYNR